MSVTLDNVASRSLAEVIGANCKRIRTAIGVTQDELAHFARIAGLRWNAAKVGDFEAGKSEPTFRTVLAVTRALDRAWHFQVAIGAAPYEKLGGVKLADLVDPRGAPDGKIALTEELSDSAELLAEVCRGGTFLPPDAHDSLGADALIFATDARAPGLAESRLAKQLAITPAQLTDTSIRLWQKTFSEERDRRAGPDANQQKRGRISRELREELQKALADGNDQ